MKNAKKRVPVIVGAVLAMTVCGALAGYLIGCVITLRLTESRLRQYAAETITEADTASLESRAMLAQMHASQYEFCSDEEIASFRNLIFLSEYLKEAGRIRDGKIVCSAMLGRLSEPVALPSPDFSQADGIRVYTKLAPFKVGDLKVVGLEQGDSYIIFSPYLEAHRAPAPIHSTIAAMSDVSRQGISQNGFSPQAKFSILGGEGPPRLDGSVYASLCSDRYPNCVTESISVLDALQGGFAATVGCAALGCLAGICLGFFSTFFYLRNQTMAKQLRRAVHRGRIQVVYQSIVNPVSGGVVGAEALSRWSDEDGVAILPEVFIKVAEEDKFVGAITRLVIRQVLKDFGDTLRSHPGFRVSVNIAESDLTDRKFLPMLAENLKRANVRAQSLILEIVEESSPRSKAALETIGELRQRGHSVLLDDFGSCFSNQSHLNAQLVDGIKIDKAFTQGIGTAAQTAVVLPRILSMAKQLNLQVIVEGIETARQASYYAATGCPIFAQGWFFGYPVPADVFKSWLTEESEKLETTPADAA